ncbi:MAG: Hpt domain-containing protein [Bacteroidales bacterium]|nr:Hpt domain-containing protein [Bacteroidales bacterium]
MSGIQNIAMNGYKHVNLDVLKEISEGNNDLMRDLIFLFISQIPVFSEQMDHYYQNKDYVSLGKLAHKIKNSVAMMGIAELSSDMKKLENLAQTGKNIHKYPDFIERFKRITTEAVSELNDILQSI